jgi:hypothetical protein
MAKFRKKPVVIEAHHFVDGCWSGGNVPEWYTEAFMANRIMHHAADDSWRSPVTHATIATSEGAMRADIGDWIIKGIKGEMYPCKPDIFAATYKVVDE